MRGNFRKCVLTPDGTPCALCTPYKDKNGRDVFDGNMINTPHGELEVVLENGGFVLKQFPTWVTPYVTSYDILHGSGPRWLEECEVIS
jgi:hypothetical protein